MFVCCECCVLLGRGLCDGLITSPEESYRLWRVVVCDQENSYARRLQECNKPQWVVAPVENKWDIHIIINMYREKITQIIWVSVIYKVKGWMKKV
jgi:hypothetical protein